MNFTIFKNSKFKSLSYYLIASILSAIIGLVINPFLSLGLSHEDFAIIGYFASIGTILSPIIAFSFNSFYARNYFLIDDNKREIMLQTLLSLFLIFGFAVFILFFVGYYFYHINFVPSIPFFPFAILSFLPIYFASFYNIYLLNLRMQNKSKKYAIVTVLNSIVGASSSIFLVYILKYGAEGRLVATFIVTMLFGLYSLKMQKFHFGIDNKVAKNAFSFCWPLMVSTILTFFFMGIDRTFLVRLDDNHSLGLYNVALQISGYLGIFGTILFQTFDPDIYKYASLKQHRKVFYMVLMITGITLIPNLVFILVSKPLIAVLTFGKYVDAASFADILCLSNVSTSFSFSLSHVLVAYGFSKYELFNKLFGAILSLILYKFLINNYGFYGAAWGQSISWIGMGFISVLSLYILRRRIK